MKSEVYNLDCMDYMATLPDNAFSLAIVDPPYGISSLTDEPWKQAITNPRGTKMRNRIKHGAGKLKNRAIQNMDSDFDFTPPARILQRAVQGFKKPNHLGRQLFRLASNKRDCLLGQAAAVGKLLTV